MRNRAKCRLCGEVLESFHRHDYVECKCKEISIDGGADYFKCGARDWANFVRLDDTDNEVPIKVQEGNAEAKDAVLEPLASREEMLANLKTEIDAIEQLPEPALRMPVSQFELWKVMSMFYALMKD